MAIRQVALVNGRALASALWVMSALGHKTSSLGTLQLAPHQPIRSASDRAVLEACSWAAEYGMAFPGDVEHIRVTAPGVADRHFLAEVLAQLEPRLDGSLKEVWPENVAVEPAANEHLHWMLGHGVRGRASSETYLILPTVEPIGRRVEDSAWVVSRSLLNDRDAFRRWLRGRAKFPIAALGTLFVDAGA